MNASLSWIPAFFAAHRGAIDFALVVAITSMPAPDASSGKFYIWFFRSTHFVVGAIWRTLAGTSWAKFIPFNGSTAPQAASNPNPEAPRGSPGS